MGRTLPTSTMLIQEFEESWQPYARALRKEDREVLGELFAMVRFQSAAIAYASRPDPFQVFALAMLGGMMKRVMHLETVAERSPGSFQEEQGETFVVDGDPAENNWDPWDPPSAPGPDLGAQSDVNDWERDPGTEQN